MHISAAQTVSDTPGAPWARALQPDTADTLENSLLGGEASRQGGLFSYMAGLQHSLPDSCDYQNHSQTCSGIPGVQTISVPRRDHLGLPSITTVNNAPVWTSLSEHLHMF